MHNDELYHYGVKGMKWGHRKAQKYMAKAKAARNQSKSLEKSKARVKATRKAEKYMAKAKAAEKYIERNKKQADIKASRTLGAKIATNLLGGFFANRTYNAVRASGGSKGKALGMTVVTSILGGPIGHIVIAEMYGTGNLGED